MDLLSHGYMKLEKVNLIVFDECHRAVSNHPMRQIMQRFEDCSKDKHPRVLAMSATLLNANIKLDKIESTIKVKSQYYYSHCIIINNLHSCDSSFENLKLLLSYSL